jgi:hypothetical protein
VSLATQRLQRMLARARKAVAEAAETERTVPQRFKGGARARLNRAIAEHDRIMGEMLRVDPKAFEGGM